MLRSEPLISPGTVIFWVYRHHLNSKSSVLREKSGTFIRLVKHGKWSRFQKAVVKFDGNSGNTSIPYSEISLISRTIKMSNDILTIDKLKAIPPGTIFSEGITSNDPEGIYMTDSNVGRKLYWVAKRGEIHDWTIYIHWADKGRQFVIDAGDKVTGEANIKKLVPCDDEAYKIYRR